MSERDDGELGVGGRRKHLPPCQRGGGGLDNCTSLGLGLKGGDFLSDPRIRDLEKAGLSAEWINLANNVGFDAFLIFWEFMSKKRDIYRRVTMPDFKSFERYQRNCYIRTLHAEGREVKEIRQLVKKVLNEHLSANTIYRAIK